VFQKPTIGPYPEPFESVAYSQILFYIRFNIILQCNPVSKMVSSLLVFRLNFLVMYVYVCMYKGWAIKLALAPQPLMIYCASPLAAVMIITVAALRIVLAHGSKPT
jgi:hypothetical protein